MDKIIPAHTATFENDYTELLNRVERQKQMAAIDKFLEQKVKDTYIDIDPMFRDCDFTRVVWKTKFD